MRRRSIEVAGLHHGGLPIPLASLVGNVLASGGISPLDTETGTVPDSAERQVELVFANMRKILEAAGAGLDDVVKCTVYVRDKAIRPLVDAAWLQAFPDERSRPARHTLKVELNDPMHLQLEILAVLEDRTS